MQQTRIASLEHLFCLASLQLRRAEVPPSVSHNAHPRVSRSCTNCHFTTRPQYSKDAQTRSTQNYCFMVCSAEMLGTVRLQGGFRCSGILPATVSWTAKRRVGP